MNLRTIARRVGAYDLVEPSYSRYVLRKWESAGRPLPAPSAWKRELLRKAAKEHGLSTLVETGTYKADTVRALRHDFSLIVSIELDPDLHLAAVTRCRGQANARLYQGDSSAVLRELVPTLETPALFWLDAHYSGTGTAFGEKESPIESELESALGPGMHIVLIDDAREFRNQANGYPPINAVEVAAAQHGYSVVEEDDVLVLVPLSGASA